ncbi:MAG: MBL fold metallo-hydrolase [Nitrospirota bacterium]
MIVNQLSVGPLGVNCYIISDEKTRDAVVIDPGGDPDDILKIVRNKKLTVLFVVITHAHFDHVGANKAVQDATGAKILMHKEDEKLLASAANQGAFFGIQSVPSPPADRYIEHGDFITVGEISLRVLHTPGHSQGGVCLLGEGVVFTGDTLFAGSIGRSDFPGGNPATLLHSIKTHLMTLPDTTKVFPGHGPASTIGQERLHNPFLNDFSDV